MSRSEAGSRRSRPRSAFDRTSSTPRSSEAMRTWRSSSATYESLKDILADIELDIQQAEDSRMWIIALGIIECSWSAKVLQGVLANTLLEGRYSEWLSDRTIKSGVPVSRVAMSVFFAVPVYVASVIHYTVPELIPALADFPTDRQIRLTGIEWIEAFFDYIILAGETFFDAITHGIRWVLDGLELMLVQSPWIVIYIFLMTLTGPCRRGRAPRSGPAAFLAYTGLVGTVGKGDDVARAAGHRGLHQHQHRHTARHVLRPSAPGLPGRAPDHGLHADHARLRLHDPGHRLLRHRQGGGGGHRHGLRRHAGGAP